MNKPQPQQDNSAQDNGAPAENPTAQAPGGIAAPLDAEAIAALVRQAGGSSVPDQALLEALHSQGTTLALLRHAYGKIEQAEARIDAYEKRVRELEELAATDPLTGLMNRRGFEKFFQQEQARIRRKHSPGALFVLIDLDAFKPLNDVYGHQAGDAALKLVADRLVGAIRIVDGAARFGGDEFALLLTQTDPDRARARVTAVSQMLNTLTLEWEGHVIALGASVGCHPVHADTPYTNVYQAADHALYADKKARKAKR